MAVSTIAQYTGGGIKLPAILQEGTITYAAVIHGADGYHDVGITLSAPLYKNSFVVPDTDAANTYAATGGSPVVKEMVAGSLIFGQIITEPTWVVTPTASSSTRADILSYKWYRIATVEWFGLSGVAKAVFVGADAGNLVPGTAALLKADDSASATLAAAGGPVALSVYDVTSGGTGMISFHYVAKGTATVSVLVGFTGGHIVIT
jgi:hypothetical protein